MDTVTYDVRIGHAPSIERKGHARAHFLHRSSFFLVRLC